MSMAAKSSDLGDRTSGASLQMEGHMDAPSQSAKDLQELEALGSSPPTHHLGPWPGDCHLVALILSAQMVWYVLYTIGYI